MDLQLHGKHASSPAAAAASAQAIARQLALEGCDVAIGARSEGPLQAGRRRAGEGDRAQDRPADGGHDERRVDQGVRQEGRRRRWAASKS